MAEKSFFITGTDTDVGKTFFTSSILKILNDKGFSARGVKPVESGETGIKTDVDIYREKSGKDLAPDALYSFKTPCSPHLAARLNGQRIDLGSVLDFCMKENKKGDILFFEGAGGLMTPINDEETYLDLIKSLDLPVVVVCDNRLGMINHTILTIENLRLNGVVPVLIVVNNRTEESFKEIDSIIKKENYEFLSKKFKDIKVIEIPNSKNENPEFALKTAGEFFINFNKEEDNLSYVDGNHLWHPYSSPFNSNGNVLVKRADKTDLFMENGKLVDGMSSWWCAVHGYNNREINEAAIAQLNKMSHVMFGGITHDPALKLGKILADILPGDLSRIFYADSGSVSVEVAMKMALQYWQGKGETLKTSFASIKGGYHGDTFGAMSVCDPVNGMHHKFFENLMENFFARRPDCGFHDEFNPGSLDEIRSILKENSGKIAGLIVEPIVQGAGGMWFYHPKYLKGLRELCSKFDVLLILDEIATGFGRTGKLFACEWAGISPDILCIGKAVTGGYLTFAAAAVTEDVAKGICENKNLLMHGSVHIWEIHLHAPLPVKA